MRKLPVFSLMVVTFFCLTPNVHALIIGVSPGPLSSMGVAPEIIAAPTDALDDFVTNKGMQGFNEAQGVTTSVDHTTDSGVIGAGTVVDSHMIFLNSEGASGLTHFQVTWTFSGTILGVMSDFDGTLEAASTFELGNPGTNYTVPPFQSAPFSARGMESNDSYFFAPGSNQILVSMRVAQPGDWIRVVTTSSAAPVPEPSTMLLLGAGLAGIAGFGRKKFFKK